MLRLLILPVLLALAPTSFAQDDDAPKNPSARGYVHSGSNGSVETTDGKIDYICHPEIIPLRDEAGAIEAEFFCFSYLASDTSVERPVVFAFNGGPGSASIWLHFGILGPRVVKVPSDAAGAGAPPYPIVDNPHTLLQVADLVMVDPIGTGYSRVVNDGDREDHWGIDEDARSVARFIKAWLTKHKRWASPKYVLGESYGGIRGPLLVRELQGGLSSVALNGLILISPALDMELVDGQDNDAALATVLPTYAATAWYHDALPNRPAELEPFLDEVRQFARDEYVAALFAGRTLPPDRRASVIDKLHRYTGLSKQYIERSNLRIGTNRFRRELLRDRGLIVGRLDSRYTGTEADQVGETPNGDPFGAGVGGAYTAAFHHYLMNELDIRIEDTYQVSNREAGANWKRQEEGWPAFQGHLDVTPEIAKGMADNPDLRLFVGNGYYDIATTFFAAETNLAKSTIPLDRVVLRNYESGHMMYVHQPSFELMAKDLIDFVRAGNP